MPALPARARAKTASNQIARYAWELALAQGMSSAEFQRATGLGEAALQRPEGRVDALRHRQVLRLLETLSPREHTTLASRMRYFPRLTALWCNSPSLRSALSGYLHYRTVLGEFDSVLLQGDTEQVRFEYLPEDTGPEAAISVRQNFALILDMARHYTPEERTKIHIDLPGNIPLAWRLLCEQYRLRLSADTGHFALTLRSALLDQPYACHNPVLYDYTRSELDTERARLDTMQACFSARVVAVLHRILAEPNFDPTAERLLDKVCEGLHMSRWTIQRHLQSEGQDFTAVLQAMRLNEARRLLAETDLPLAQISECLGFQSQSTFTRFFSRATGSPPARFRQGLAHDAGAHDQVLEV